MPDMQAEDANNQSGFLQAFVQKIKEKQWQFRVSLVTNLMNLAVALLIGALSFSGAWLAWISIISWILLALLAGLIIVAIFVKAYVAEADRIDDEKRPAQLQEAKEAVTKCKGEQESLKGQIRSARAAQKMSANELTEFRNALKGVLLPLAGKLEEIPLERTEVGVTKKLGQFQRLALTLLHLTACKSNNEETVRTSLYELDCHGLPKLVDHMGRAEAPRSEFEGESLRRIQELIRNGDANVFAPLESTNCITRSPGSTYEIVVASSVGRKPPGHGMLAIDSSIASQLSEDDLAVAQAVGGMLAASYRIVTLVNELETSRTKESTR